MTRRRFHPLMMNGRAMGHVDRDTRWVVISNPRRSRANRSIVPAGWILPVVVFILDIIGIRIEEPDGRIWSVLLEDALPALDRGDPAGRTWIIPDEVWSVEVPEIA